ncbi:MAG: 4-hydroxybutyrate--acetyl-CoA CoA transferase [Deltaproteobacteria bacterium]|nr:4-hydroxybutyrate--acetyl-CoA CoA transferase [Deltaproteobacteria bacterium]
MANNIFTEMYKTKLTTPEEAVKAVKSGFKIGVPLGVNDPPGLAKALCDRYEELENVRIIQSFGPIPRDYMFKPELKGHFFYHSGFHGVGARMGEKVGIADFEPHHISTVGDATLRHHHLNVYWTTASPMDEYGNMTMGLGNVYDREYLDAADIVMVEINENLPRLVGDAFLNIREVDYVVENTVPLLEVPEMEIDESSTAIGEYIADLIEDESTIQLGIGGIPNAVGKALMGKRDLGVHTEMFTDSMVDLYEAGVITNMKKTYMPGRMTACFAVGTKKLYNFLDNNYATYFLQGKVSNDEYVIGQNRKQISVNTGLCVDLAGQMCAESIGPNQYSGVGGGHDFPRGARRSDGGKSIIALLSTAKEGAISTITPMLPLGSYVTVPRTDINYIVTEYGVAQLEGKTRSERARQLIAIAHPDFRKEIEQEAAKLGMLN